MRRRSLLGFICWDLPGHLSVACILVSQSGSKRVTMRKNLCVGSLAYSTNSEDLREAFEEFGEVTSAQVIMDRETGRSRGFGFVEMSSGAEAAVSALNGTELH